MNGADRAMGRDPAIDAGTIGWLLPEIANAFDASLASLRSFRGAAAGVDRRDVDLAPLRIARSRLHQAHGALAMLDLGGPTRLTDAVEELFATFETSPERCDATALDAVVGAFRALTEYLEDLQTGHAPNPLHLFPSYRALLVARGVERVHPADLLTVDLGFRPPRDPATSEAPPGANDLAEQRAAFEQGLLRYLRNDQDAPALEALSRAVARIDAVVAAAAPNTPFSAYWWVARALFEALAQGGFAHARAQQADLKRLAGRVNLQMRQLVEGSTHVAERLFADTLFLVALAKPVTPHVAAVQAAYRLEDAVPADYERQRYGLIDATALRGAREVLGEAKHAWSAIVGGDVARIKDLARLTGLLLDAVTPFRRRGLVDVAQSIDGIATELGFDPRRPSAGVGLDVATALLFLEGALEHARWLDEGFDARAATVVQRVEASALGQAEPPGTVDWLDRIARQAEERLTMATFVGELQANLRHAEKILDAYFRAPGDEAARAELAGAETALIQVSGALALLGHDRPHRAVDHARTSIERFRSDLAAAAEPEFERVASSLGAVGFYVDQIKRDRIDHDAFAFDEATGLFTAEIAKPIARPVEPEPVVAEAVAASVEIAVPAFEPPPELSFERTEEPSLSFAATQILDDDATLEEEMAAHGDDANAWIAAWARDPSDTGSRDRLAAWLEETRRHGALIDDPALQHEATDVLKQVGEGASDDLVARVATLVEHVLRAAGAPLAPPVEAPPAPVPAADDVDAVDAELLEIFLEEARLVLDEARDALRALDGDPANTTALAVLRRGFHTLKGSSRMVGLMTFGEAAWSIEETLNDFLAEQRRASSDLRALVDYAIRYLDDWVGDLKGTGRSQRVPDALIEGARALRTAPESATPPGLRVVEPVAAAPVEPEPILLEPEPAPEEDFQRTILLEDLEAAEAAAPVDEPPRDLSFAATQVIDRPDDDLLDIEFFGEQPKRREDATPIIADLASGEVDLTDLAAQRARGEPSDDFAKTVLFADLEPDAPAEAAPTPAPETLQFAPLVFDDVPVPPVDPVPTPPAPEEPTGLPELVFDEEPVEAATIPAEPIAHDEPAIPDVPTVTARGEDTVRIGPLVLSVALFNIYLNEADELLRVLGRDFAEWRSEPDRFVSESAMRAAHSLAGSSATVGLEPAHDLAAGVEDVLQQIWRDPVLLEEGQVALLQDVVEALVRMLHGFAAERMPEPDPERVAALAALRASISGTVDAPVAASVPEPEPEPEPEADDANLPAPSGGLGFASLDFGVSETPPAVVGTATPATDDAVAQGPIEAPPPAPAPDEFVADDVGVVLPDVAHEPAVSAADPAVDDPYALDFGDLPVRTPEPFPVDADVESIELSLDDLPVPDAAHAAAPEVPWEDEPVLEAPAAAEPEEADADDAGTDAIDVPAVPLEALAPVRPITVERGVRDEIDPDLLDVFIAEGAEILPAVGELLRAWQGDPSNRDAARQLLRHLHTLKGSARMAGAMRLGEVVHEMEARVESAARLHDVPPALLEELLASHDRSLELFDALHLPIETTPVDGGAAAIASAPAEAVVEGAVEEIRADEATAVPTTTRADRGRVARDTRRQAVRVGSETLDRLVNLAGEVSISRARVENEVAQIKGALSDLGDNVERLRGQLREIELQAEFQLQSRMQSQTAGEEREKFDPLEFDRFTRFQELTRMMAESVNDVKTVQQHLQKGVEGAEIDLSSQRRMTRDLQQDLMRVRMVPFASVSERLYRVARRAAKEVDKRVNLDIRGGAVEIDRGVLERMSGPFEHLLRNHIVHGIESRESRRRAGKSETGELLVEVRQEGNEMVLTFSDDGAGLDHARIRERARELGLTADGEIVGDAAAAEFIFHPGFSTADEVTELAGRGVGMDVVRAEAQGLAGRVEVESEDGRGTRFTIHLPLTLAVTQVVLVRVAGRIFALPAVLVEQVRQLRPEALSDAYRAGHLEWLGERVPLAFLGRLLEIEDSVAVAQRSSPVLVLRSAAERIAIHVDEVVGNQEAVVKNLGPQLARMPGIVGATVLGSGEIVLILNPVQIAAAFAPKAEALPAPVAEDAAPPAARPVVEALRTLPTVMVVDDSLTVRRVTQRLLSREGYQVVLAKDGVDALEQLQDYPPDAMLVDIEMPRMDGFDLARNVRNDSRYRNIPLLMITSRTADKHRQHAMDLGVDAYLGKPYQEEELLELLAHHISIRRSQPA